MEEILAAVLLVGGGMAFFVFLFVLSLTPIGRAIAARIRGEGKPRAFAALEAQQNEILEELASLRHDMTEVQARMDFTERLAGGEPPAQRLPPGQGPPAVEE